VVKVDPVASLLYVRGAIPGANQGVVIVQSVPERKRAPKPEPVAKGKAAK
jgi:ribosomal protein L3